jgi:hypothetical protein
MRILARLRRILGGYCCLWLTTALPGGWADEPLVKWLEAWREREARISSGRFEWSETRVIQPHTRWRDNGEQFPDEALTKRHTGITFQFAGARALYRYFMSTYDDSGLPEVPSVHAFDDEFVATYDAPRLKPHGQGVIHARDDFREYENYNLWPMLYAVRPVAPRGMNLGQASLEVVALETLTQPVPPALLEQRPHVLVWRGQAIYRRLFLDQADPPRLLRMDEYLIPDQAAPKPPDGSPPPEILTAELEIQAYQPCGPDLPDLPARWSLRFYLATGPLRDELTCDLTACSINDAAGLEPFSIVPFPDGTLVMNERDDSVSWQRGTKLEPNGEKDRLPPPAQPNPPARSWWLLIANGAFLAALLAYAWARRRSRNV